VSKSSDRDKEFIDKNLDLIFELEKYILEPPEFAERIPQEAIISLQIEGDEEFNRWSRNWPKVKWRGATDYLHQARRPDSAEKVCK